LGYAHAMISHGDSLTNVYTAHTSAKKDQLYKDLEPYLLIYGSEEYVKTQSKMQKQLSTQRQELKKLNNIVSLMPDYFKLVAYDVTRPNKYPGEENQDLIKEMEKSWNKMGKQSTESQEYMLTLMSRTWKAVKAGKAKLGPTDEPPHIETDAEREEAISRIRKRRMRDGQEEA